MIIRCMFVKQSKRPEQHGTVFRHQLINNNEVSFSARLLCGDVLEVPPIQRDVQFVHTVKMCQQEHPKCITDIIVKAGEKKTILPNKEWESSSHVTEN